MTRYLAALAILPITALPLWIKPAWVVGVLAIGTGLFCAAGLLGRRLAVTLAGCVLAATDLALALWWSAASLSAFSAAAFGLALLFLLDATHFARQFAGARIDRSAWRAQLAWWIARAAGCFAATLLLVAIAWSLALVMPTFGRPILAATGALAAVIAALWVALSRREGAS
jgi:hypothetical protein